jgi:hypothetical protein
MSGVCETTCRVKSTIFWDITPSSPLTINRRFGGTYRLQIQGRKISLARSRRKSRWQAETPPGKTPGFVTLKMEAIYSSETPVDTQRTTRRYIPEDGTLHKHRGKILKCFNLWSVFVPKISCLKTTKWREVHYQVAPNWLTQLFSVSEGETVHTNYHWHKSLSMNLCPEIWNREILRRVSMENRI